ncbi:DUF2973 domain-containing protein [Leptolyngbya sp. FACHB-711]|jgi:hypothetical protein|uniref:DUF2973 domain-containing protein n=1 Tax=unclassified Leptolyngbya TaxID=2650499 RepID=UPI001688A9F9|nr:DUF2973 domain-containing protein [Leptolyngbya sp. FACHB-711]MBD1850156.1 DUF2973 domain-containing protein [Cyanobacteria bacterium FACHB-502]MBD2023125.1 DUF2973 domain-containing protein [Leptolyngbya sp. FACHB-711]
MFHLLYIFAFTILAFLAVGNLIRSMMMLGIDSQRSYGNGRQNRRYVTPHPELLDDAGNLSKEPYLVMRSISVEDARERLDALFNASPGGQDDPSEETR